VRDDRLRARQEEELGADQKAAALELFFDLAFVFAITQVTNLRDPTPARSIAPARWPPCSSHSSLLQRLGCPRLLLSGSSP
jgi:hypothetical protein